MDTLTHTEHGATVELRKVTGTEALVYGQKTAEDQDRWTFAC